MRVLQKHEGIDGIVAARLIGQQLVKQQANVGRAGFDIVVVSVQINARRGGQERAGFPRSLHRLHCFRLVPGLIIYGGNGQRVIRSGVKVGDIADAQGARSRRYDPAILRGHRSACERFSENDPGCEVAVGFVAPDFVTILIVPDLK